MIPDFQTLMRPLLALLADGEVWQAKELREKLAGEFELDESDRAAMLPSGRQRTFDNRVGWANTYLYQAGLIERPGRGKSRINPEGRAALRAHPDRIDMSVLEAYPAYIEFRQRQGRPAAEGAQEQAAATIAEAPTSATPTNLLEEALATNQAALEGEILKAALGLDPFAFEQLVIELLGAMGYGKSGALERMSATGDAGVDGIISQDPLGLDRIYVQAKRYAPEHPITRPQIHSSNTASASKSNAP